MHFLQVFLCTFFSPHDHKFSNLVVQLEASTSLPASWTEKAEGEEGEEGGGGGGGDEQEAEGGVQWGEEDRDVGWAEEGEGEGVRNTRTIVIQQERIYY